MMQLIKTELFMDKNLKGFYLELLTDGTNALVCIEGNPYFIDTEKVQTLEDLGAVFYNVRLDVFGAVIKLLQGAQDPSILSDAIAREYA